jgi:hypothetical protein
LQHHLKQKIKLFWPSVIAFWLCLMGCYSNLKAEEFFLFENNQVILQFKCHGACEKFPPAAVQRFFKLYFRDTSSTANLSNNKFTPLLRHQYKLKVQSKLSTDELEINYFDVAENIAQQVTQQFCSDHHCSLVVKVDHTSEQKQLHLIKNKTLFSFQSNMPESFVQKILQASDYDQFFIGPEIKVIYAAARAEQHQIDYASVLVRDGQRLHLFPDQLKTQHLELLKTMTQADCAYYKNLQQWIYCKNENILQPPKSLRLKITTPHGQIFVQNSNAWEQTQVQKMMHDLQGLLIEEDHSAHQMQEQELTIEYRKSDQTVMLFHGSINNKLRDAIHLHMTQSFFCDSYNIYQQKNNQAVLVLQNKMPRNLDLINMLDAGLQKKTAELTFNIINRTQEITAPTNMSYLKRDKLSSLSTLALKAQVFPTRTTWGAGAGFELYQVNNQAIDGSNVVDIGSQNSQYHAQISHRFYPKNKYAKAMLITSLGIEQRNFEVDSNNSIGSLSYMLQYLSFDLKVLHDLYKFNFIARSGFINGASQTFQSVQNFNSSSGMFLDLQAVFSREMTSKIDLNLMAGIRQDKMQLNNADVNLQEFNLALGLTYHWGDK